jgi:site-specific recombinase XerD
MLRCEREVPLNDHAFSAVTSLLGQRAGKSDFLFHHRDGSRVKTVQESFGVLIQKSQLQGVIPYTLRHTFGAWSVKVGISMRILQKLMGHSTIVVTERYSHVANDDMAAAVNRLNYFLSNLLPSPLKGAMGVKTISPMESWCRRGGVEPPWY